MNISPFFSAHMREFVFTCNFCPFLFALNAPFLLDAHSRGTRRHPECDFSTSSEFLPFFIRFAVVFRDYSLRADCAHAFQGKIKLTKSFEYNGFLFIFLCSIFLSFFLSPFFMYKYMLRLQ